MLRQGRRRPCLLCNSVFYLSPITIGHHLFSAFCERVTPACSAQCHGDSPLRYLTRMNCNCRRRLMDLLSRSESSGAGVCAGAVGGAAAQALGHCVPGFRTGCGSMPASQGTGPGGAGGVLVGHVGGAHAGRGDALPERSVRGLPGSPGCRSRSPARSVTPPPTTALHLMPTWLLWRCRPVRR